MQPHRLLLRRRLARRGLAPAVVLLADAYRPAGPAPAAPLVTATAQLAAGGAAGVSARVARMTEGALRAMAVTKLRPAALLLVLGLAVGGLGVILSRGALGGPPAPTDPPRVAYATGRAVGAAVVRNRVRRRLRAAVRDQAPLLRPGRAYLIRAAAPPYL